MPRRTPVGLIPDLPKLGPREVRAVRVRAGLSQALFAECLNVSHELAQAWESGRRTPRGAALRLLAIAQRHPEVVFPAASALPAAAAPKIRTRTSTPASEPVAATGTPFDALLCGLVDQGVRFVLVGGLAAQLRGAAVPTDDADIVYDRASDNLERLSTFLRREGSSLRGAPGRVVFAADPRTLAHTSALALETRSGPLDLRQRVAGIGEYGAALARASVVPVAGRAVPTLSLEALVGSRRASGRPRDREQLPLLEELASRGPGGS